MKQIGIVIDSLITSQLCTDINVAVNQLINEKLVDDICVFYNNFGLNIMTPPCPYLQTVHMFGFKGQLIATSLSTARTALSICPIKKPIFLVYELEWLKEGEIPGYNEMISYYHNPNLRYLTRSKPYAQILKNNFNIEVEAVVENTDLRSFINAIT